jgi:hypothetical protein
MAGGIMVDSISASEFGFVLVIFVGLLFKD